MTDPTHTSEPAEGDVDPGSGPQERTPHPEQPAEGSPDVEDVGGGADTPGQA